MTPQQHTQLLRELADLHKKVCIELSASLSAKGFDRIKELETRALQAAEEIEVRGELSDEEIEQLAEPFQDDVGDGFGKAIFDEVAFARAVLARFGGGEGE